MIRSMTGFGRAAFELDGMPFEVEIRSVNHRNLDVRARLPRALSACEPDLKARAQARLSRGRIDASVVAAGGAPTGPTLEVDPEGFARLVEAARELAREHDLQAELRVADLLAVPGVVRSVERELDPERLAEAAGLAWDQALDALEAMRAREGESLDRDLRSRLDGIGRLVDQIETRAEGVVQSVRDKLRRRTEQLELETGLLDEARLHQEIIIAADRLDVTEEIVRLRSHLDQFARSLAEGEVVGRRLDFLIQEMGRETNTIGSKGSDADLAHLVVDLKTELERIREQVQNVE